MKKIATLLAMIVALPLLAADFPKGSPDFQTDFEKVTAKARESGKPVLLVISADWCLPCQELKKGVYPDAAIQPYHDKFEWAYLDFDAPATKPVIKDFKVRYIPHIQFISADGKPLEKHVGEATPAEFAKLLDRVLKKAAK
jgi:thioredoxin-like negative regulator of GroEL